MDSIKWKCNNWIVYFKSIHNFHLIHIQDLDTSLKKYMKSGNITETKIKTLKDV